MKFGLSVRDLEVGDTIENTEGFRAKVEQIYKDDKGVPVALAVIEESIIMRYYDSDLDEWRLVM